MPDEEGAGQQGDPRGYMYCRTCMGTGKWECDCNGAFLRRSPCAACAQGGQCVDCGGKGLSAKGPQAYRP
eukprot:CAMPEP_0204365146 /NCGR_PEP_ID=MMETSP0469-20131031/41686_1 /ASSEMBLY_ACC=CAM_ASM_000384 /TAXON_ID=2969 /ORGANISM="Oxyrrhis marina" /LENGTH=69 /DNA_ID=CAMNT_0051354169 /DNA_START=3 /DNA_END=208 /DNA_ORIENTATION=+